jgi:hypothetical protein
MVISQCSFIAITLKAHRMRILQLFISISSVQSESQLMVKYHQGYYQITVTDHLAMSAKNIDQLLNLYDTYLTITKFYQFVKQRKPLQKYSDWQN